MTMQEKRDIFEAADVTQIDMKLDCVDLKVEISESAQNILVEIWKDEGDIYESGIMGGVLRICYKWKRGWWSGGRCRTQMRLLIPKEMQLQSFELEIGAGRAELTGADFCCGRMRLETGAGSIQMGGLQVADSLNVKIGAGRIGLLSARAGRVSADCGMGEFRMDGRVERDLMVECGMGSCGIRLKGNESDYNYNLSCGMGKVGVNGSQMSHLGGKHVSRNQQAKGNIAVSCGMGSVELYIA